MTTIFRSQGSADVRLSEKEEVILTLLSDGGELFGLAIVEQSDGRVVRGTVYVTLGRMEEKGFITSRQEERQPAAIGLPRRLYKITGLGESVLRAYELAALTFSDAMVPA